MKLTEAQDSFIESWGALGSQWGISKTMAQIHALLLISPQSLCAEDVMSRLNISRGNANMNMRALIDWGLAERVIKLGERKEFFKAEKDMWKVVVRIAQERRKRELQPILRTIEEVSKINDPEADALEMKEFVNTVNNIGDVSEKINKSFDKLIAADEHWFTGSLLKLMR
ncbi:MAG: transcriptional regulator [Flavobacteriales bacterium]|nr:transcriptional regulator [Flavobacteriales bacterium]